MVDGILDLFDYAKFKPCGTTAAGGRLTFTGTVPFNEAAPFEGGCLLPVPALWIRPEGGPAVVCTSGFGTFVPLIPRMGSEC